MNGPAQGSLVLGFQPSSHGFGWIAFSTPFAIHDWGIPDVPRGTKNESSLRKLEGLLDRLEPYLLVLEAFEQRSTRIARLCQSVVALARSRGIDVAVYTKGQIEECFRSVGAKTRHEVASAIARSFDMLRADLPAKRKAWDRPHRKMPLFEAAAVVLTHFQLGTSTLFDDLLNQTGNGAD